MEHLEFCSLRFVVFDAHFITELEFFLNCPKVTFRLEKLFSSMLMIISEEFHIDPENLSPQVTWVLNVILTENNPSHDQNGIVSTVTWNFQNGTFRIFFVALMLIIRNKLLIMYPDAPQYLQPSFYRTVVKRYSAGYPKSLSKEVNEKARIVS